MTRLLVFRGFAHDSQRVLAAVHRLAVVGSNWACMSPDLTLNWALQRSQMPRPVFTIRSLRLGMKPV